MNKYFILILSLTILSCSSIESTTNISLETIKIDENKKFLIYLDEDWEKGLQESPLFATYIGDKRFNDKINSNSVEQYFNDVQSSKDSLKKLKEIYEFFNGL